MSDVPEGSQSVIGFVVRLREPLWDGTSEIYLFGQRQDFVCMRPLFGSVKIESAKIGSQDSIVVKDLRVEQEGDFIRMHLVCCIIWHIVTFDLAVVEVKELPRQPDDSDSSECLRDDPEVTA